MNRIPNYPWKSNIDYKKQPNKYSIGKGEQGVLLCEPYKSQILKYWRFETPIEAEKSSKIIYKMFKEYLKNNDFIGADMARKYLQMGFTRARRYANYKGGKKYKNKSKTKLFKKGSGDPEKIICSNYFYDKWIKANNNTKYKKMKSEWKNKK